MYESAKETQLKGPSHQFFALFQFLRFSVYKRFLRKVGLFKKKCKEEKGGGYHGYTFLRKPLSRTGNFRENKLSPLEILLTCMTPLLVDPLEFPHVLSSVPLEILCPQPPWKFLNFSALVLMNYFVVKKRVQRVPECKKTDISFHRLLKIHILHITFTKKSVHETFLLVLFI